MKNRASKLDARVDKVAAGFTIIETILFIAIAGLVFTGVIVGTNGAIRRQRYKDTVQSFTDDLRDLYSIVENIEVIDYGGGTVTCGGEPSEKNGRGRSNCSVYGIVAKLSMHNNDDPGNTVDNIEAYWLVGKDEATVIDSIADPYEAELAATDDAAFLYHAEASPFVKINGEETMIEAKKASLYWGAELSFGCNGLDTGSIEGCDYGTGVEPRATEDVDVYLVIYRSPITGAIRTKHAALIKGMHDYFDSSDSWKLRDRFRTTSMTGAGGTSAVHICIMAGTGMSYDGGLRMISIDSRASNSEGVRLVEADDEENICND